MSQIVKYAITYATQNVTDAEYDLVYRLYNIIVPPQKSAAIRFIKQQYNLKLIAAKAICNKIGQGPRPEVWMPPRD